MRYFYKVAVLHNVYIHVKEKPVYTICRDIATAKYSSGDYLLLSTYIIDKAIATKVVLLLVKHAGQRFHRILHVCVCVCMCVCVCVCVCVCMRYIMVVKTTHIAYAKPIHSL